MEWLGVGLSVRDFGRASGSWSFVRISGNGVSCVRLGVGGSRFILAFTPSVVDQD